jgi:hypothetical protein
VHRHNVTGVGWRAINPPGHHDDCTNRPGGNDDSDEPSSPAAPSLSLEPSSGVTRRAMSLARAGLQASSLGYPRVVKEGFVAFVRHLAPATSTVICPVRIRVAEKIDSIGER